MSKNHRKKAKFFNLSPVNPKDMSDAVVTNPTKKIREKVKKVSLNVRKRKEKLKVLHKGILPSKIPVDM